MSGRLENKTLDLIGLVNKSMLDCARQNKWPGVIMIFLRIVPSTSI